MSVCRALAFVLLSAAGRRTAPTSAAAQGEDPVDPREHQRFADDLTTQLYTRDNECSSALGVSMAFSLVWPGCTGDAVEEVRETLRYPAASSNLQLVWDGTTQRMLAAAAGQCVRQWGETCNAAAPLLKIANSVWFHDDDALNPDYASVVGEYARQIDFAADDSPLLVNEWVSDATEEMIDSIVPADKPLYPPNVLIAINSIYLKAAWDEQFQEYLTNLDSFYPSVARTTEVSEAHFMHAVGDFAYSHEVLPGYQAVALPFAESRMSMVFVLPMMEGGGAVLSTDVAEAFDGLQSTRLALSVPKFKFESEYAGTLKDALIRLGIKAPFTEGSGALCGLFEGKEGCDRLVIGSVIQKTVIDVNEKGVEAAAVTAISVSATSVGPNIRKDPVLMILDHPFQFFIYDKAEDLMLFEGRLGAPELPAATPAMDLLDARHEDNDFWSKTFYVNPVVPEVDYATITKPSITPPACSTRQSCQDCLVSDDASPSTCAWVPVGGCMDSCMIADTACYAIKYFADEGLNGQQICAVAAADEADSALCGAKSDCASCTAAVLSNGSTCQWFSEGGGFCGSECGFIGCGKTTCDSTSITDVVIPVEDGLKGEASDVPITGSVVESGSTTTLTDTAGLAADGTTKISEPPTDESAEEPDPESIVSSGNISDRTFSSLCTGIVLAFALRFV